MGNLTNVMQAEHTQLNLLNIKHVFYLSAKPFEEIDKAFKTTWIEISEVEKPVIEFD